MANTVKNLLQIIHLVQQLSRYIKTQSGTIYKNLINKLPGKYNQ